MLKISASHTLVHISALFCSVYVVLQMSNYLYDADLISLRVGLMICYCALHLGLLQMYNLLQSCVPCDPGDTRGARVLFMWLS